LLTYDILLHKDRSVCLFHKLVAKKIIMKHSTNSIETTEYTALVDAEEALAAVPVMADVVELVAPSNLPSGYEFHAQVNTANNNTGDTVLVRVVSVRKINSSLCNCTVF
jgi:hypothetical protein